MQNGSVTFVQYWLGGLGVFGLPEKLVCMPVDLTQPFGVFIPVSYATEDTTEFFKAYVNSSYI